MCINLRIVTFWDASPFIIYWYLYLKQNNFANYYNLFQDNFANYYNL